MIDSVQVFCSFVVKFQPAWFVGILFWLNLLLIFANEVKFHIIFVPWLYCVNVQFVLTHF